MPQSNEFNEKCVKTKKGQPRINDIDFLGKQSNTKKNTTNDATYQKWKDLRESKLIGKEWSHHVELVWLGYSLCWDFMSSFDHLLQLGEDWMFFYRSTDLFSPSLSISLSLSLSRFLFFFFSGQAHIFLNVIPTNPEKISSASASFCRRRRKCASIKDSIFYCFWL